MKARAPVCLSALLGAREQVSSTGWRGLCLLCCFFFFLNIFIKVGIVLKIDILR